MISFKKSISVLMVLALLLTAMPITAVFAEEEVDLYARQVERIPYYSSGRIKFSQTSFGEVFKFDGETNKDASGERNLKRLTATNQNEIWRLMMEEDYLFTGWNVGGTEEQLSNGEIYAQLDLGGATPIDAVEVSYVTASILKNDKDYPIGRIPKLYRFDVSNDGENYTTVKTVTTDLSEYQNTITTKEEYINAVQSDPELYDLMNIHKVEFDNTVNCRYIRFVMLQPTQDWLYNNGDRSTIISNYQLYTYNTWLDEENYAAESIAPKDANGVYQLSNNGRDRNIIGFSGETNLSAKRSSRVTYLTEKVGRDWNLDEGALQSSYGNFALSTGTYSKYTDAFVYLQYDFGYPERIDTVEQWYRNADGYRNVNDIPKTVRLDYGDKDERGRTVWTKGQTFTTDMSSSASVGEKTALAYNNYIANGSAIEPEKLYMTQPVKYELSNPITARFLRIVYLQPTQNGTLPTSNKLLIKKTKITDLTHMHDENTISASDIVFRNDGSINLTNLSDNNLKYPGETGSLSRFSYSPDISWQDWYYRHLVSEANNSWTGWKSNKSNYVNGKVYLMHDYGADIAVDKITLYLKSFKYSGGASAVFNTKWQYANDVPKTLRVDCGTYDEDGKIQWTQGDIITTTVDDIDLIRTATSEEVSAAFNAEEKTAEQQALFDAIDAVPTVLDLPVNQNARFTRIVILDPIQTGIENHSGSDYTWYLNAIKNYGSVIEVPETSAEITSATSTSVAFNAFLADEDSDAVIIVALFDGNELVGVKTVEATETSAAFEAAQATTAKIFIWSNKQNVKPIVSDSFDIAQ